MKKYDPDDMLDENNLENLNSIFVQLIEVFAYIEEKVIIHRDIREKIFS